MAQLELFDQPAEPREELRNRLSIPGLTYRPEFVTVEEEQRLLAGVDARPWLNDLKRQVQHYGYKYDYKARAVNVSMYLGPLPEFVHEVAQRLVDQGLVEEMPDQMIVNEYKPGQGIAAHIDCQPCFKDTIVTVSLGWAYEMEFTPVDPDKRRPDPLLLERRSVLVMQGEARYEWMHQIRPRLCDGSVRRERRVSLTFRKVILGA